MNHIVTGTGGARMGAVIALALGLVNPPFRAAAQIAVAAPQQRETRAAEPPGDIRAREPAAAKRGDGGTASPFSEGRRRLLDGNLNAARASFRGAVGGDGATTRPLAGTVADRWFALALLQQKPPRPPYQEMDDRLRAWADADRLREPDTWNLALRLVLRQVYVAPSARKPAVWRAGIDSLRAGGNRVRLAPKTLTELDQFLHLNEPARGIAPADALADLILLAPDASSLAALHGRLARLAARSRASADTLRRDAWTQMALSVTAGGDDFATAAEAHAMAAVQAPAGVGDSSRRSNVLPIAPAGAAFDSRLSERARAALMTAPLKSAASPAELRRFALLQLFAGESEQALRLAYAALLAAGHADLPAYCDDLATVAAFAAGNLRGSADAELALVRRFGGKMGSAGGSSDLTASPFLEAAMAAAEKAAPRDAGAASIPTPFRQLRRDVQAGLVRRRQAHWAERRVAAARAALARGADDVAVTCWLLVLEGSSVPADAVRSFRRDLRELNDAARAAGLAAAAAPHVREPRARRDVIRLEAELLYGSGQVRAALEALDAADRIEGVAAAEDGGAGLVSAGLIRASALHELGRHGEALAALDELDARSEFAAERAFLRGRILLSRNEAADALALFRHVADARGGSAYAASARELIRQIEPTDPFTATRRRRIPAREALAVGWDPGSFVQGDSQSFRRAIREECAAAASISVPPATGDAGAAHARQQWRAISLLKQPPPVPQEQIDSLLRAWRDAGRLDQPVTWNLALRLVLRQVYGAEAGLKAETWRTGLALLHSGGDGVRFTVAAIEDLDRFLGVEAAARGIDAEEVLLDLLLLTPDAASVASLHARLMGYRDPAAGLASASVAWTNMGLSVMAGEAFAHAAEAYLKVASAGGTGGGARPGAPGGKPKPVVTTLLTAARESGKRSRFDSRLAERARTALAEPAPAARRMSPRQSALLHLFAGRPDDAVRLAYAALARATYAEASARCDDLVVVAAVATGDLRAGGAAERALFRRFVPSDARPGADLEAESFEAALDEALEKVVAELGDASRQAGPEATPLHRAPAAVWSALERRRLASWAEQCSAASRAALARKAEDLAVTCWLLALEASPAPAASLGRFEAVVRGLNDGARAADLTSRLVSHVRQPRALRSIHLIQARLLYESGQMQAALDAIDAAEGVPLPVGREAAADRERLSTGLTRAVALIKLSRADEALKHLESLGGLEGDGDSLAQRAFLIGWIHLSRNETAEALVFFRQVVDEHGGSSFGTNSRELIHRLEPAAVGARPLGGQ